MIYANLRFQRWCFHWKKKYEQIICVKPWLFCKCRTSNLHFDFIYFRWILLFGRVFKPRKNQKVFRKLVHVCVERAHYKLRKFSRHFEYIIFLWFTIFISSVYSVHYKVWTISNESLDKFELMIGECGIFHQISIKFHRNFFFFKSSCKKRIEKFVVSIHSKILLQTKK